MNTIKIYGASDDLVEISGDLNEEYDSGKCSHLLFNDGTQVRVEYDKDGVWRVLPVTKGESKSQLLWGMPDEAPKAQCHGDKDAPSYSDCMILAWDKPFKLIKWGKRKLTPPAPEDAAARVLADKVIELIESTYGGEHFLHEIDNGEDENEDTYEDFKERLITVLAAKPSEAAPKKSGIVGNVFAITGTLSISRADMKQLIEDNGGEVASSISSRVNYLVCGSDAGSKVEKARALGIEIITEDQLDEML